MPRRSDRLSAFDALPLYPSDAELAPAIMGSRANEWRQVVAYFEGKGLPPVHPIFGGRYRYAVLKWLDEMEGVNIPGIMPARDGADRPELWGARRGRRA